MKIKDEKIKSVIKYYTSSLTFSDEIKEEA